ncbi:MAG: hypothetical protein IAF94_23630 [Pirellulaceae bacterium]|nr:hypothetical protein [Pirellulaceae bacterium]
MTMNKNFLYSGSLLLLGAFLAGCGSSGPARSAVEGAVTVGGQPLPAGRIIFTPLAPNKGPATSARITAGRYQIAKSDGPVIGKNRVDVEADLNLGFPLDDEEAFTRRGAAPIPPSPIPPNYSATAQLSVEIQPGEINKYDVPIPATAHTVSYR